MKAIDFLITLYEHETAYSALTYTNAGIGDLSVLAGADSEMQPLLHSDAMMDALRSGQDAPTFCIADDCKAGRDLINALSVKGFKPDAILSVRTAEQQTCPCNYVCYLLE